MRTTTMLRQKIFREFPHKVVEDVLFGNGEGSLVSRWQGPHVRRLVQDTMQELGISDGNGYRILFDRLDGDPVKRETFIARLLEARRQQREVFIEALFSGCFWYGENTREEFEKLSEQITGKKLSERPFFTFVRGRLAEYKCSKWISRMCWERNSCANGSSNPAACLSWEAGVHPFAAQRSFP